MIVHDVLQRSPEWAALRLGRVGSSRAADMLATIKSGGEAAGRRNLRAQLVLERLTRKPQERTFQSQAMLDGIEREADAVNAYEAATGRLTRSVGFVSHDTLMAGYSPDGVIGDFQGLIECKCPIPATHLDFLLTGKVADDYLKQVRHGLWLTGAAWCDFVSWNPDFPEGAQLKIVRVASDPAALSQHDAAVKAFLAEVDQQLEALLTALDLRAALAGSAA